MSRGQRPWRRVRIRRCLVSGIRHHQDDLLRFVVEKGGRLRPDPMRSMAGRGYWVECSRASLQTAVSRNLFARAARRDVVVATDILAAVEQILVLRLLNVLNSFCHLMTEDVADCLEVDREGVLFLPRGDDDGLMVPDSPLRMFRCLDREELHLVCKGADTCGFVVPSSGIGKRIRLEAGRLMKFRSSGGLEGSTQNPH